MQQRQGRVEVQAQAGANGGNSEQGERQGFIANLLKPLRDFGLGRSSMVQGGVGLFIFAGIGEQPSGPHGFPRTMRNTLSRSHT
jgi:hypothetical protein